MRIWCVYVRWFFVLAGAFVGAVACVNWLVDPFDVNRYVRIPRINQVKPAMYHYIRVAKTYAVSREQPQTILLGNSIVEVGMDPDSSSWPAEATPIYNLGLSGATVYEALRYFQHAHAVAPVQRVIYGLDFFAFQGAMSQPGFSESRLAVGTDGKQWAGWDAIYGKAGELARMTISREAVMASSLTLYKNLMGVSGLTYFDNGLRDTSSWDQMLKRSDDYHARFYGDNFEAQVADFMEQRCVGASGKRRPTLADTTAEREQHFAALKKLVNYAQANSVELKLYISPLHAWALEDTAGQGQWEEYERWKRRLVNMVEEANAGGGVALWDFSGFNEVTTEPIPASGERRLMQSYFDHYHFRKEIGDRILAEIMGNKQTAVPMAGSFGARLSVANIDAHLVHIRGEREQYRQTQPRDALAAFLSGKLKSNELDCAGLKELRERYLRVGSIH